MRRRILLLVVATTLLVVLAFAVPLLFLIRDAVPQGAKNKALSQADSVAAFLRSGERSNADITNYVKQFAQDDNHSTGVVLSDGATFGVVRGVPDHATQPGGGQLPGGFGPGSDPNGRQPAQLINVPGGKAAVTWVPVTSGRADVSVFVSSSALDAGLLGWYLLLAGGSVALLIIAWIGGELVTRRLVRPLNDTAQTANRLTAGDVTARAPASGPREVAEVGVALNRLAERIDQLIAEERETVADLSHRLRTPLTALRLDAETLSDAAEAERVSAHVSALERMLTAVIRAARRPQREGRMPSADAHAVVGDRVEFWSALTEEQGRVGSLTLPPGPVLVRASGEDLAAAIDALLENVIAHTPDGTPFAVTLEALPEGGGRIQVADDGPGLPDEEIVRGRSDRGSSGLGLDIARRCAEAGGGAMRIGRSPAGGAAITLELRAP